MLPTPRLLDRARGLLLPRSSLRSQSQSPSHKPLGAVNSPLGVRHLGTTPTAMVTGGLPRRNRLNLLVARTPGGEEAVATQARAVAVEAGVPRPLHHPPNTVIATRTRGATMAEPGWSVS